MILISRTSCEDRLDALKKERDYLELFQATLNKQVPSRTNKEWVEDKTEYQTIRKSITKPIKTKSTSI